MLEKMEQLARIPPNQQQGMLHLCKTFYPSLEELHTVQIMQTRKRVFQSAKSINQSKEYLSVQRVLDYIVHIVKGYFIVLTLQGVSQRTEVFTKWCKEQQKVQTLQCYTVQRVHRSQKLPLLQSSCCQAPSYPQYYITRGNLQRKS